jgi:hypothetical protein
MAVVRADCERGSAPPQRSSQVLAVWCRVARMKPNGITEKNVHAIVEAAVGQALHTKRVFSLALATLGVIHAGSASVRGIGQGLGRARGKDGKHGIKQTSRMLSNEGIDVWRLFAHWVPFVLGSRKALVVTLDWTDFDADGHTTVALQVVTRHGRTTPLLWKTVPKEGLAGKRNEHEDELLGRLREVVPEDVEVTVLADRGFGDVALYEFLTRLGFYYVVRFRGVVHVEDAKGEVKKAKEWVPDNGRPRLLKGARVTHQRYEVGAVVCVQAKDMKEEWCLATNLPGPKSADVVKLYGKRFRCEETHRDVKNLRFGLGMSAMHLRTPQRRDRLLLVCAMALALLTLLGAAGEATGLDKRFRADTRKAREYSLFNQGLMYYDALPNMREERRTPLLEKFAELVSQHAFFREIYGII